MTAGDPAGGAGRDARTVRSAEGTAGARLPVAGIVLAGGAGRRFGGAKLAADVGGRPLLVRAIEAVAAVSREVVVVGPPELSGIPLPALPGAVDGVPVLLVRDAVQGRGPLAGFATGLAVTGQPFALLVGGDQPALVPELLAEMVRWIADERADPVVDAVVLEEAGRLRPLPAAFRVSVARPAAAANLAGGGASLIGLLGRLRTGALAPERWRRRDPDGSSLRDVDRPEDIPPG